MSEKKTKCERLYQEYDNLVQKINTQAEKLGAGAISAETISDPVDFLRKEEIRRELLDCRSVLALSDKAWFEIENG